MYLNTSSVFTTGKKGDVVCRPGDWMDVVKFFLFNFVVHAVTVVNAPGAKSLRSINGSLTAILLPFSGAYRAFQSMAFYRWAKEDDLPIALRAQALCTPIPSEHHPTGDVLFPSLNVIEVHGQHSVPTLGFLEWTGINTPTLRPSYHLSRIPWWFAITPLKPPSGTTTTGSTSTDPGQPAVNHNPMSETKISCDYNVVKIFAAILQILSGLFQIYQSRGTQLVRYGYSAYSLTVVPYVLMSLVNLLVCICVPQYPMMYLVYYGGKKRPLPKSPDETPRPSRRQSSAGSATLTAQVGPVELPTPEQAILPPQSSITEESPLVEPGLEDDLPQSPSSTYSGEDLLDDSDHFEWEPEAISMVSGVVGVAYGDWDYAKRDTTVPHSTTSTPIRLCIYLVALVVLVAPYTIMLVLTNFSAGESTNTQRSWILAWLIMGQVGGMLSGAWENEYWRVITRLPGLPSAVMTRFIISFLIIVSMSIGTIGGFVVVGDMILEDQVCTII